MIENTDILTLAYKQPIMQNQMQLLLQTDKQIRGSVQYSIKRYAKKMQWHIEDTAMLMYNFEKNNTTQNFIQLNFCVSGNVYCSSKKTECDFCKFNSHNSCDEKINSVDVLSFTFTPSYLKQFVNTKKTNTLSTDLFSFNHTTSFTKTMPIIGKIRTAIEALLNHNYTDSLENIFLNAQTQILLLYSIDSMFGNAEEKFTCKFLANEADREKISYAREVLLQHIGEPLTIKALSRKAAINECYLKKGFKEMFGTTIFDFYQTQRMEHAKYLLYDKGLTVTEVSALLGYSSISHFSTAFKKHTGIKPCELLLR